MNTRYDFIIVGAGPSGTSVAINLAKSRASPRVLLIEAGDSCAEPEQRTALHKFQNLGNPKLLHHYKSHPQEQLANRSLDFFRGKGIGGSTIINFSAWTKGSKDDWQTIAASTGDADWSWENAQRRWKSLETYHSSVPEGLAQYLSPERENHGDSGPLHVGHPELIDTHLVDLMETWKANGAIINTDIGSGNPLGVGICPVTEHRGIKSTPADLLLYTPSNLKVITGSTATHVMFKGNKAIGVELSDARRYYCSKEVILSAGSFDTPRILLRSGIGSEEELSQAGVDVLHCNPNVGNNFLDHYTVPLLFTRAAYEDSVASLFQNPTQQKAAFEEWRVFRTGPYATRAKSHFFAYLQSEEIFNSEEFASLPDAEQRRLGNATIPHYQIACSTMLPEYLTADTASTLVQLYVAVLNTQGKGRLEIQNHDLSKPLAINPGFMNHPFDVRALLEATKAVMSVTASEFAKSRMTLAPVDRMQPQSDSDADVLQYWRDNCITMNHACGTCKMQMQANDTEAVVDSQLRVVGLSGLRIADMSIMPFVPNANTQTVAYQIGMIMAEKLVIEYGLDASFGAKQAQ